MDYDFLIKHCLETFFCFGNTKMSNGIIALVTAIGTVALFIAIVSTNTTEGFWNIPSRTWKVEKVLEVGNRGCKRADFFQTPNFQSILSPRFSNVNYGAYIRTVLPPYGAMAVPQDPLNKECAVKVPIPKLTEGFDYGHTEYPKPGTSAPYNSPINPRVGSPTSYANGNFHQVQNAIAEIAGGAVPTDTVVEGNAIMMGTDGEMMNPIVYDRYIYANRNSRLRSLGDKFRGDLPIAPNNGNWFTPNVHPNIDLEAGAINVMAGVDNATSNQVANLIYNASGRADTTIAGVDMAMKPVNTSFQTTTTNCAAGGDLRIAGFP